MEAEAVRRMARALADTVGIAVQVNGKLRGEVVVAAGATEAEVRALAEADPKVQGYLSGKVVKKVVYVPKRLLNYVVAG